MRVTGQNIPKVYEATPLNLRKDDSIRLLTVLAERSPEGYVQCILFHSSINEMESAYTCLSYVWGDRPNNSRQEISPAIAVSTSPCAPVVSARTPLDTATPTSMNRSSDLTGPSVVMVNWKPMEVLPNLYDFLQIAGQKFLGEPLWIDALCINQNSTIERNHQVARMGEIYSHARNVIAWLGPCNSDVNLLDMLREQVLENTVSGKVKKTNATRENSDIETSAHQHTPFSRAVDAFWSRAWITQELAVARQVHLLFGAAELDLLVIDGEALAQTLRETPELGWQSHMWPSTSIFQLWVLATDKRWENKDYLARIHNRLCMFDLLSQHRYKKCLHGRDRIYSLRYLCVEGNEMNIDYEMPSLDLLSHITQISERWLCFCAALALIGALVDDEEKSKDWNSLYLAVKLDIPSYHSVSNPWLGGLGVTEHGASEPRTQFSLNNICRAMHSRITLNPSVGAIEYETSSGERVQIPSSQPEILHSFFDQSATEHSLTVYLAVPYLQQIIARDKSLENTLILASETHHDWKEDSVFFVHF